MSNSPILPIPVSGAIAAEGNFSDENLLPTNNPNLDEGESNDDSGTVEEDVREADAVNDNLDT
jgi:hypothetical protein